jgi:hypothetical protein
LVAGVAEGVVEGVVKDLDAVALAPFPGVLPEGFADEAACDLVTGLVRMFSRAVLDIRSAP